MAARQQPDSCIFCLPDPCTCNTSKKSTPVKRVKPAPNPPEAPPREVKATIRSVGREAEDARDSGDKEMRRALTVLCQSGLVCANDIEKHRGELNLPEVDIDILIWRQRRWQALYQPPQI